MLTGLLWETLFGVSTFFRLLNFTLLLRSHG